MNEGWMTPAFVSVDQSGKIVSIKQSTAEKVDIDLNCYALPGIQNAHSHAFQYAMAGLAETHSVNETPDDFWSWRDAMYQLALSINPDQLKDIAAMLYAEMMRHGYTHVAEFHYVHHDKNGNSFANKAEMSEKLIEAAKLAGIGITLVPIFYQKGGFGKDPVEGQKRFISKNADEYFSLFEACEKACANYEHANCAIGIHSLRAVDPLVVKDIALNFTTDLPFHIHISEQLKEVKDSIDFLGKRPVEWLIENCNVTERFHLVHATHLSEKEVEGIAKSKANVVLCPSTEGNLGDGIFPLKKYQELNGSWSIGTDSHVGLNPFEELRILDYGQRLTSHKRNTFYNSNQGDSGNFAMKMITSSGRKSMNNFNENYFEQGASFDAVLIDADHPLVALTSTEKLTSTIIYSSDVSMQKGVICKGQLYDGLKNESVLEKIRQNFVSTIENLGNRK